MDRVGTRVIFLDTGACLPGLVKETASVNETMQFDNAPWGPPMGLNRADVDRERGLLYV